MGQIRSTKISDSQLTYSSPDDPKLKKLLIETLEFATGRRKLQRLYDEVKALDPDSESLWPLILSSLEIELRCNREKLDEIPSSGPLVFVANHPFGVLDGLIMGYLVSRIRKEFHIMANHVLCGEELIGKYLLPIDFRENKEALLTNINTRRIAMEQMKKGHTIAIFPAGGVSTAPKIGKKAEDFEWKRFVVKLITQHKATVVPIFFHGQNSQIFQVASHINMNLRYGLLLNEVRNKMGKPIKVTIGDVIPYQDLGQFSDRQLLLDHLRQVTYDLART